MMQRASNTERKRQRIYTFAVETGFPGAETRQVRMAKMLAKQGYYLTWYGTGKRRADLAAHGVQYKLVPSGTGAGGRLRFAFLLARRHLHRDALAFAFNPDVFIGMALSRIFGIHGVFIYFCRNDLVYQNKTLNEYFGLRLPIARHFLRQLACYLMADRYVVQSDFGCKALKRRFSFVPKFLRPEILVLPNDLPKEYLGGEMGLNQTPVSDGIMDVDEFKYAFIANPAWHKKGFDILAATIAAHFGAQTKRRIYIIGAGEAFNELESQVGTSKNIVFHGYESDVLNVLGSVDTLFAPTVVDHFPNVVLEAVMARKPVICTRIDAHENILGRDHLLYFERDSSVAEIGLRLKMSEDPEIRLQVVKNQLDSISQFNNAWEQGLPKIFK